MWSAELTFRDELVNPGALVRVEEGVRALHFGVFWFPHDDPLAPNASRGLCSDRLVAVQDHLRSDTRVYACCDAAGWCPVPPPPERTSYTSLLFQHRVGVWGENRTTGEWTRLRDFVYFDPVSVTTLVKRALGVVAILVIVWTTFVVFATGLQKGTGRFPKVSVVCHLIFLVLTLAISMEMMLETSDPAVLVCLCHVAVDSVASALAVYVPSEEHKSAGVPRLARWSRRWRHVTETVYMVWRAVGVVTGLVYIEEVHYRFQLEWTELVAVTTVLATMQMLHAVAFLTALFEIDMPLRVGDELVVHRNVKHVTGEWTPQTARLYVLEPEALEVGWVRFGKHHITEKKVKGIVYVGNAKGDLERCGSLQNKGYVSDGSGGLMRVAAFLLRIRPVFAEEEDDYNLNAVHNLREACFSMQKKGCASAWWLLASCDVIFFLSMSIALRDPLWSCLGALDTILLIGVLFGFGGVATTTVRPRTRGVQSCPEGHTTVEKVTDHLEWVCDRCSRTLALGTRVDFCPVCDWCVCGVCDGQQHLLCPSNPGTSSVGTSPAFGE